MIAQPFRDDSMQDFPERFKDQNENQYHDTSSTFVLVKIAHRANGFQVFQIVLSAGSVSSKNGKRN
jgi:hypothetical protein